MNKKCARESYPNTETQSSVSPALCSQLSAIMDVEVFIDTWLQDLVTNLRQLMSPNTPLSSNMADILVSLVNPLNAELNPICYLLALLGAHHFLHVSRIRVKSLILRLLMLYIYGAPILDVSRSHTTTHHSR